MHSGENPRRFAALGNAHQDGTDCFYSKETGDLRIRLRVGQLFCQHNRCPFVLPQFGCLRAATHGIATPCFHPGAQSKIRAPGFPPTS